MLTIDGSQKSGSGTIIRDAVAFSAITRIPIHVFNIRARRNPPGLRPQHLTVIRAIATLCNGSIHHATVGATEIHFTPGSEIVGGEYTFDIGTAGSALMLANALLLVALFAKTSSRFTLIGGLFQDFAPSAFHFQHVLLPLLHRMGINASVQIVRPGYVPKGNGKLVLTVSPVNQSLIPLELQEQGEVQQIEGIALASRLKDRQVANRMANTCIQELKQHQFSPQIQLLEDEPHHPAFQEVALQPGAALAIWASTSSGGIIGADMAGKKGRSSEFIGKQVARMFLEDVASGAAVDRHLADQWIPFAAFADGTSTVKVPTISDHIASRLWLVKQFLPCNTAIHQQQIVVEGSGQLR